MTVIWPGRAGTEVELGITRNGVPFMRVVVPVRPGGASERGMLVGPGMRRKGVPFMIVVLNVWPVRMGIVVGWITTNGVPFIIVVLPIPGGRPAAGTVVGAGMTKTGVPEMIVVTRDPESRFSP